MIVELAAATTTLAALHPDDHPAWAGYLRRAQHHLATAAERGEQPGGPNHPATTRSDAHRRAPGAVLDRWIRVRDRHCPGPAPCTRPTHAAQIDHTRDWAAHGLTVAANLSPPCAHCHALKHPGHWQLTQPDPGRFLWTSPLGARYPIDPRPVLDTPLDPSPRDDGRPRPVLDVPRPPRPTSTGERHPTTRHATFHDIPTPPPDPTQPPDPDNDPPPF